MDKLDPIRRPEPKKRAWHANDGGRPGGECASAIHSPLTATALSASTRPHLLSRPLEIAGDPVESLGITSRVTLSGSDPQAPHQHSARAEASCEVSHGTATLPLHAQWPHRSRATTGATTPSRMAMPAISRTTSHTTTARPSISPLSSSASKPLRSSPRAMRDSTMHDVDAQLNSEMGVDPADADVEADADLGDDDGSSGLSEPDDDEEEEEDGEDANGAGDRQRRLGDAAVQRALEVDSEAETERLEQTPRATRQRDDALGRTPSKLSQAATAEDDLSDPPSPLPTGAGNASSTSTVATAGQKRKRSDTAESPLTSAESDIGESPRKRSHEMTRHTVADADGDVEPSTEVAEPLEDTLIQGDALTGLKKGVRGRKGKRKGAKKQDDPEADPVEPTVEVIETVDDQEATEESAPKTEEDLVAKTEASGIFEAVAKQFLAFRERLTNERLATLTSELTLLSQPQCMHPEYLRQIACVDARLQKQVREAHAYYNYRLRSIRDRTLGERSQLHSQYYQSVREKREHVLDKLGEDWYAIQKERRSGYELDEGKYIHKFPQDKNERLINQAKWNQEVSVLSGVAKYVGFPAAPELEGVEGDRIEEDLRAMKVSKRIPSAAPSNVHAPPSAPAPLSQRPLYLSATSTVPSFAQNERLAHEQFIEQNAWARPPHAPAHHAHAHGVGVGTPGISHTPDWAAEPANSAASAASARNLLRDLSGRVFAETIGGRASPIAIPSTGTNLMDRLSGSAAGREGLASSRISSSPLGAVPKVRQNELTGFRNISNLSNLSGISGTSTIDAPTAPDAQDHDRWNPNVERSPDLPKHPLPQLTPQASAPHSIFETSQLHRHAHPASEAQDVGSERERDMREVYSNAGFRPQEGAFGTPTPAPASSPLVSGGGGRA